MAEEPSIFQKIAGIVGTYAPGLATLLAATGIGAPIAAAVGAVGILAKSLGMPETAKPEDVLSTIQSMPDSELKLKFVQAEQTFQLAQREQEIQIYKSQLADVQSAREMANVAIKATGKRDYEDKVFDWVVLAGLYLVIAAMLYFKPPESTILGGLIGTVGAGYLQVLNFRKGSNKSSENKTAMIYNSVPANQPKADVEK